MRIVLLCGPPCAGKTTLAHHLAGRDDVVLDYDDIARALGSPALWSHDEPWRTHAEQVMQARIADASAHPGTGTAYVLRTAPRPTQRARLATQWQASVYLLNPGEAECRRRAVADHRPSGTRRAIGQWYHRYAPWSGDLSPASVGDGWMEQASVVVDPRSV